MGEGAGEAGDWLRAVLRNEAKPWQRRQIAKRTEAQSGGARNYETNSVLGDGRYFCETKPICRAIANYQSSNLPNEKGTEIAATGTGDSQRPARSFVPPGEVADEPAHLSRAASLLRGELFATPMAGIVDGKPTRVGGVICNPHLSTPMLRSLAFFGHKGNT